MYILGISAYYHDSAAALLCGEKVVAAAQEERFTRIKHDAGFPVNAIKYCLKEGGISLSDLDSIVFYEKPFLKFERLVETYLRFAPSGFRSFCMAIPIWIKEKLFQRLNLQRELKDIDPLFDGTRLLFSEHHLSHAASAFFASPFDEAVILTMDGVGEWTTTSLAIGRSNGIDISKEIHFPNSLGLFYSAFTYYCGFKVNSGEYKLMGLAPYGVPKYCDLITSHLIDIKEDGSFRLNQDYFNYCVGLTMTNRKFAKLFGEPVRSEGRELTQFHMDLAASIQTVTQQIVIRLAKVARVETGVKNLCLAGGVALNCVANGRLHAEEIFDDIWIQPAAGDAGGALGCALAAYHMHHQRARTPVNPDSMEGSFLGPGFSDEEIQTELQRAGANFTLLTYPEMLDWAVSQLTNNRVVGWFQGRMEFGPRALGNRSILGDPRSETMQKTLNLKIKYRESFRPFAPAVLEEEVSDWFDLNSPSPYMLRVDYVSARRRIILKKEHQQLSGFERLNLIRSSIPAVTHVDNSARIQTVDRRTNSRFHDLISEFDKQTGCPVLINTSFNVRGEPLVCSPSDAFNCFMGTEMDALIVGNCVMIKSEQAEELLRSYKDAFQLD